MIETVILKHGYNIKYVNWNTVTDEEAEKLCIMACNNKGAGEAINNYKKLTKNILLAAVINWTEIWFHRKVDYIPFIDQDFTNELVKHRPFMYSYISKDFKTQELTLYYIENYDIPTLDVIPINLLNYELCEKIINKNGSCIDQIFKENFIKLNEQQILNLCIIAIKQNVDYGRNIIYTKFLALELIKINPIILQYIKNQDVDIVYEALKLNLDVIKYVNLILDKTF